MILGTKDKTEQLCPVEQGRPVSQSENSTGSPPKIIDRASLLSQAVQRNARHVWGERAAHQARASAASGALTTLLREMWTGSAIPSHVLRMTKQLI